MIDNREDTRWSLYVHIVPKEISGYDHDKYYVGITCKKRPQNRWGRNGNCYKGQYFMEAIKKYGWNNMQHEIITTNLTKNEAEKFEIRLIKELNSTNSEFGYNISKGGKYILYKNRNVTNKPVKVVLLNYNLIFETYYLAAEYINQSPSSISSYVNNKSRCRTKDNNGKNLTFVSYDEYINMTPEDIKNRIDETTFWCKKTPFREPIVCLNTEEIFNYKYEINQKYNSDYHSILDVCKGERRYAGKTNDGIPLVWAYLKDYNNMSQDEIKEKITNSTKKKNNTKKVVDLNTNILYSSVQQVSKIFNVSEATISFQIHHKSNYLRKYPDTNIILFDEYLKQNNLSEEDALKRLFLFQEKEVK